MNRHRIAPLQKRPAEVSRKDKIERQLRERQEAATDPVARVHLSPGASPTALTTLRCHGMLRRSKILFSEKRIIFRVLPKKTFFYRFYMRPETKKVSERTSWWKWKTAINHLHCHFDHPQYQTLVLYLVLVCSPKVFCNPDLLAWIKKTEKAT